MSFIPRLFFKNPKKHQIFKQKMKTYHCTMEENVHYYFRQGMVGKSLVKEAFVVVPFNFSDTQCMVYFISNFKMHGHEKLPGFINDRILLLRAGTLQALNDYTMEISQNMQDQIPDEMASMDDDLEEEARSNIIIPNAFPERETMSLVSREESQNREFSPDPIIRKSRPLVNDPSRFTNSQPHPFPKFGNKNSI
jgi:hypothetical protein